MFIGGATSAAIFSGANSPRRLGTSSPTTTEKYVSETTTIVRAIPRAYGAMSGHSESQEVNGLASALSPMAPLRIPTVVMPT